MWFNLSLPPPPTETAQWYKAEYRQEKGASQVDRKYLAYSLKMAIPRYRFLQSHEALFEKRSVLDIGCGAGIFLHDLDKQGWDCYGVEPDMRHSAYAREVYGLKVETGLFEPGIFENKKFCLISLFQVLEHLADPLKVLRQIWDCLETPGFIFVEVPDIANMYGEPTKFFEKAHLYYFRRETLAALLAEAGFVTEKIFWRKRFELYWPYPAKYLCVLARKSHRQTHSSNRYQASSAEETLRSIRRYEKLYRYRFLLPHYLLFQTARALISAMRRTGLCT